MSSISLRNKLGKRMIQSNSNDHKQTPSAREQSEKMKSKDKWSLGILNDKEADEVPGSILLLSEVNRFNAPLGLHQTPSRRSTSSLPSLQDVRINEARKKTADGKFILEPQPTDSKNDPLNWPVLRRDLALVSLGLYCMIGGGMTPILAAGFSQVANDLHVTIPQVALTTGLYMMGLGLGSVVLSPTAILYGKRPVYLIAAACFVIANIWCALSPNFASLVVARVFMGFAVSSVECLPSASIAEIYFLHEKAYRLGIYTLLLLGGKNLVPLISAIVIESLGWRWVFWIVAIVVSFAGLLLFFFVPETFWDRSPIPRGRSRSVLHSRLVSSRSPALRRQGATLAERHAHFDDTEESQQQASTASHSSDHDKLSSTASLHDTGVNGVVASTSTSTTAVQPDGKDAQHDTTKESRLAQEKDSELCRSEIVHEKGHELSDESHNTPQSPHDLEMQSSRSSGGNPYTKTLAKAPEQSFIRQLRPYSGRLNHDNWFKVALRPFVLFAYPAILWSSLVYALSIGWLIVLSESVSSIYENRSTYNFTPLQVGLVYISPFIGGILGTAVAGKVSDLIVQYMARKNGGIYEPEFRLVMAIPITITTVIGLMGFGWSVAERDAWIVPTVFFALISFGCSLGSTTAITFAVDSYRQYAGEALVTLNFSKNIFHGLVWSLFFNTWLNADGSKTVFVAIGGIQLACLLTTIPMYIYGKRGRMWTVRKNLMEKF